MSEKEDESKTSTKTVDDDILEKLAVEELLREAVQGAARAELIGPSGWIKAPKQKTNKKFLANTIRSTVASNKYHQSKAQHKYSTRNSFKKEKQPEPTIRKDKSKRK